LYHGLPALELVRLIYIRKVRPLIYKLNIRCFKKRTTPHRLLRKFRGDIGDVKGFVERFKGILRQRFFLSDLNRKEFYVNLMTSLGGFDSIMDDADLVHENKFKALGSPVFSFGEKFDWHLDFKTGFRWRTVFYTKIDPLKSIDHSDIKVPWELSRFHQAIWLGKAYWVSNSEVHARKFKEIVSDWIDCNPVGYGINWVSPMEVSIRAMNLIVGLMYFIGSKTIDDSFFMKLLCSLYDHGIHIYNNLEKTLRSGNHYVSNLVGLIYVGIFFHDTKDGRRWFDFAKRELDLEILNQTYPDGTDYEKSTGYQRLVSEMLIAAYVLLKLNNFEVSEEFSARLERMFDFLASATMQDGETPQIGDSDDGRIFKMKSQVNSNRHRDILAVSAAVFGNRKFKYAAKEYSELALLLLGTQGFEKFSSIEDEFASKSTIFRDGGFAFLRSENVFCSFDFGDIGKRGRGGHGHNDVLSFTLSGKNQLIVDRGTYCYTCDVRMRNKLRSAYSHNTAIVDGIEHAEFSGLWSVKRDLTSPELLGWTSTIEQDVIEAQHHAYERLNPPVVHQRRIIFNKTRRTFVIEDNFLGDGDHQVELMFHFAPGIKVTDVGRNFLALESTQAASFDNYSFGSGASSRSLAEEFALLKFQYPVTLENWEHSPSYGVLESGKTARLKVVVHFPTKFETFIFILSTFEEMNYLLNHIG
jgi:hypothetical protein